MNNYFEKMCICDDFHRYQPRTSARLATVTLSVVQGGSAADFQITTPTLTSLHVVNTGRSQQISYFIYETRSTYSPNDNQFYETPIRTVRSGVVQSLDSITERINLPVGTYRLQLFCGFGGNTGCTGNATINTV